MNSYKCSDGYTIVNNQVFFFKQAKRIALSLIYEAFYPLCPCIDEGSVVKSQR